MNTRRIGKIARLPKAVREIVNQMLEDGDTYDAIIQKLEQMGYPGLNPMNLHRWKNGGFRDWELEQIYPIREQNLALTKDPHPNGAGLMSMQLATQHFYLTLMDFDHNCLRRDLKKHPENYFRILRSFNQLIENRIRLENLIEAKGKQKAFDEYMDRLQQEKQSKPRPQRKNDSLPAPLPEDQEPKPLDDPPQDQAAA